MIFQIYCRPYRARHSGLALEKAVEATLSKEEFESITTHLFASAYELAAVAVGAIDHGDTVTRESDRRVEHRDAMAAEVKMEE
jgi:hypothetical protein